jgi:hypothetical protein
MTSEDQTISTFEEEDSFVDLMDVEQSEIVALSLAPKNKVISLNSNVSTTQICASMKARKLPEEAERAPVDIVVALDVSYSMSGGKLELCKTTLELLLRHLLSQDRFGLVAYSDNAFTEVPLQLMTSRNKGEALKKIKALHVTGRTNISEAISLAFQELRAVNDPNKVQSAFLLTDGHANQGVSDHAGLVELTKSCALASGPEQKEKPTFFRSFLGKDQDKKQAAKPSGGDEAMPISMFCFGYGSDHNAALLRDISDATQSGSYYHVKDDSDVGSAFGDAMGGLLSVLAQSAVLRIQAASGVTINKVYHKRVQQRENGVYTVNVGDFFAEEERDVLVEVSLAQNASGDATPIPHLSVSLAYTDVLAKKPVKAGALTCSIVRPAGVEVSADDEHVAAQWLRVVAAREMEAATTYADQNDLVRARERIQFAEDQIFAAPTNVQGKEMVRQLRADLQTAKDGLASRQQYRESGSHYLQFKSQTHSAQRCSEVPGSAPTYKNQCYATSTKTAMASKFTLPKKK